MVLGAGPARCGAAPAFAQEQAEGNHGGLNQNGPYGVRGEEANSTNPKGIADVAFARKAANLIWPK